MAPYSDYSFEELRWAYELGKTTFETVNVDYKHGMGYEYQWTPTQTGSYHLEAKVDGFEIPFHIDFNVKSAKQPPETKQSSVIPPTPMHRPRHKTDRISQTVKSAQKASKAYCPLISSYAGSRIRSHPTLNAQIIGAIPRGATISYIEIVRNTDGAWLRLTDDVRSIYCDRKITDQAYVLQYNNHLKIEHIKLAIVNGNVEGDVSVETPHSSQHTPRGNKQQLKSSIISSIETLEDEVLRPLTVDCFRTVFSAYIWHEQLVYQLQECARKIEGNAVNFRECLRQSLGPPDIPLSLHSARTLWSTIAQSLNQIVRQHLIIPSLPTLRSVFKPRVATLERLATDASNDRTKVRMEDAEEVCELCGELNRRPITSHMRTKHPGINLIGRQKFFDS